MFTFLTRITGASFPETVQDLGRKVGIEMQDIVSAVRTSDRPRPSPRTAQPDGCTNGFSKICRTIGPEQRRETIWRAEAFRQATIERFGIGVAPVEWDGLIRWLGKQGTQKDHGGSRFDHRAGQWDAGIYDRFRARVMFTITDLRKRIVGFGGRVLGDGTPKYLNSPDTPLFKKGQTLFALDVAREAVSRTKTVIVVEGYFDAIALHQAGLTHTVATLGTALTPDHIQVLRRFASKVVLLFDPDAAGVRAALRGLDLFVNSGLGVKVVTLPAGEDPDTYVRKEGARGLCPLGRTGPESTGFCS